MFGIGFVCHKRTLVLVGILIHMGSYMLQYPENVSHLAQILTEPPLKSKGLF